MPIRVDADTSVYGGVFDPGIDAASQVYHGVNLINGFESLSINTPAEVIAYEN